MKNKELVVKFGHSEYFCSYLRSAKVVISDSSFRTIPIWWDGVKVTLTTAMKSIDVSVCSGMEYVVGFARKQERDFS